MSWKWTEEGSNAATIEVSLSTNPDDGPVLLTVARGAVMEGIRLTDPAAEALARAVLAARQGRDPA